MIAAESRSHNQYNLFFPDNRIRIFNLEDAVRKGVVIKNFNALDAHPDMILFTGWYKKNRLICPTSDINTIRV